MSDFGGGYDDAVMGANRLAEELAMLRARLTALAERWERRHGVAVSGDLPPDTWRCAAELRAILKGEHDEL